MALHRWLRSVSALAVLAASSNGGSRSAVASSSSRRSETPLRMLTYRSRDGSAFFRFRLSSQAGDMRVYILAFPNPRTGSCHVLHDHNGPYICWSGVIRSVAGAKAVAATWAEATLVYQRTGREF